MLGCFMLYSWVGLFGNGLRRFMKRIAYYIRVSTVEQNLARQEVPFSFISCEVNYRPLLTLQYRISY